MHVTILSVKEFLILVTFLGILATDSLAFAQSRGDGLVQMSLERLLAFRTIRCDIRIETFVDGVRYTALGRYAEQVLPQATPETFLRSEYLLEINFPIHLTAASDSAPNRMALVCYAAEDGRIHRFERYVFIEGNQTFSMIDLRRLETRLQETLFFSQASEVRNLGGFAGKMRQISRFYEFSQFAQDNFQDGETTIPALRLNGTLRNIYHRELLGRFGRHDESADYPVDFPSDIEVWLGRHDDFPYKIRYFRRISGNSDQKQLVFQESFHNVELDGEPIPSTVFAPLAHEGAFMEDVTDAFLQSLGL